MRKAQKERKTNESFIQITLEIDGEGKTDIQTGVGFFDHMLTHIGKHSFWNLTVKAVGDLEVDCHHTVEDTGIVLGQVVKEALGNKEGIVRYGHAIVPMDEALILCAIDLSGRAYLEMDTPFTVERVGDLDTEMVEEFFRAFANQVGMNLHIKVLAGKNNHHIIEGMCKALAKAMLMATTKDARISGVLSTKGMLEV